MRWVAWVMGAAVVCGASGARAQDTALLGRSIVAVAFESAAPIDVAGLTTLMPLRIGEPLRAEDLREAYWRLMQTDLFTRVEMRPEPRGDAVAVIIAVDRQPIVNSVSFSGNDEISDRELRRIVRLRENMALSEALQQHAVQRITGRYAAQGFDAAQVSAEVKQRSPGEVDVVFHVDEGEPLRVAAIVIEGNGGIALDTVRAATRIKVGDRYVRDEQRKAEKAIISLYRDHKYYEVEVSSKWENPQGRRGTLRFTIQPGQPFELTFSGNQHFRESKLIGLIDLPKRAIVTDGTWRELARRAEQAYQQDGYYFAKVSLKIDEGPPKQVRFSIDEGRLFRIARVDFKGNHGLSDSQLLEPMATRPPSWFPWRRGVLIDSVLDDDLKRLWYLYRKHGYESAQIIDARTVFDRDRDTVLLTVVVDEGAQTIVERIERAGMEPIGDKLGGLTLVVKLGAPLDPDAVANDRQALLTAFARTGYTNANVKTEITTQPRGAIQAASVHFDAVAGEQQRVGTILVQNNFDTHASVIVRELPFNPGDPLDPNALLAGQTNIYRLGLFRSVTVRPMEPTSEEAPPSISLKQEPRTLSEAVQGLAAPAAETSPTALDKASEEHAAVPLAVEPRSPAEMLRGQQRPSPRNAGPEPLAEPNHVPIFATVAEKPPGNLQYGGGYNTRDGFRGFMEASDDNLQGLARRLSLRGDVTIEPGNFPPNQYLGDLGFREPRLDGTKWSFRSNLIGQRSTRKVDQFSLERIALVPGVDRYFFPALQAGIDLQVEQARIFDLQPDVAAFNPRDQGRLRTIGVGPFMIYDGRDSAFVPTRGTFESVRLRIAPRQFGSQIPFLKLLGEHAQYIPLTDDLTAVYAMRSAYALPLENGDIIPIRERFFLGGRTTVRGFSENQIGPKGSLGNPLGGDLSINLNTELRFPLQYGFGGVVFVDAGGVYLQDHAVSMHELRRSTGVGLRYVTPVGPISLDYGFKLDRRTGESVGEVHFSIGTIF